MSGVDVSVKSLRNSCNCNWPGSITKEAMMMRYESSQRSQRSEGNDRIREW